MNGETDRAASGFDPEAPPGSDPGRPSTAVRDPILRGPEPVEIGRPDRIRVVDVRREDVAASHADVYVEVRGAGHAIGDADRAASRLAADLGTRGIAVPAVEPLAVRGEAAGGWFGRKRSMTASIRLRRVPVEALGKLLEALAARPGTQIRALLWEYADGDAVRDAWIEAGLRRAGDRARRIAAALGVRLLGVHDCEARCLDHDSGEPGPAETPRHGVLAHAEYDLGKLVGLTLRHTKAVEVRVAVEFRVSGFEAG